MIYGAINEKGEINYTSLKKVFDAIGNRQEDYNWKKLITLQHPLAHLEIVAWDSSLTLIFSDDKAIVDDFMMSFPYSQELEDYIENRII